MALSTRTSILIRDRIQFTPRREEGHLKTKGRDGSDEDTRYADSHPKAPTARGGLKNNPTEGLQRVHSVADTWISDLCLPELSGSTFRFVFKSPVCSNLLPQP